MTAEARRRREEELDKSKFVGTEKIAIWLRSAPPRLCGQNQKEKVYGNEIISTESFHVYMLAWCGLVRNIATASLFP
jgi:hypothetical protein